MDGTPFALAPGTGASVSARSLGMAVPELILAGDGSHLAQPTAAFPSASPQAWRGSKSPIPPCQCPWHPWASGSRTGVPARSSSGSPITPRRGLSSPSPALGTGGGQGRIPACLGHVPSFSA